MGGSSSEALTQVIPAIGLFGIIAKLQVFPSFRKRTKPADSSPMGLLEK